MTDSLIYEIESEDLHEDFKSGDKGEVFSNLNEDNRLPSKHQKIKTLDLKDIVDENMIQNIFALKSNQIKSLKKSLKHPVFFQILARDALFRTLNNTINCEKHDLLTLQATKISLSCFDAKG